MHTAELINSIRRVENSTMAKRIVACNQVGGRSWGDHRRHGGDDSITKGDKLVLVLSNYILLSFHVCVSSCQFLMICTHEGKSDVAPAFVCMLS
jgi:hypothetical protein